MQKHIEAQKRLLDVEIEMIDEAIVSIGCLTFLHMKSSALVEELQHARHARVEKIANLDTKEQELAGTGS